MKNIIPLLFVLPLITSCSRNFLETSATDEYDESFVFSTTENTYAALNGIHRAMVMQYNTNLYYGGYPSFLVLMELLGDDVVMTGNGNGYWKNEYQWKDHRNESGVFPFFAYHFFYKLISNANMILAHTDAASGPEGTKKMLKGQALAYRGLSYFWLVQLFGKRYDATTNNQNLAVSLVLSPGKLPRETVANVYKQIIIDLEASIKLLSDPENTFKRPVKNHFTTAVVKGLRARVALTMQDWENAKNYAEEAIRESGCTLMNSTQYREGFNQAKNPEWLWGYEQNSEQSVYFHGFMAIMSYNCYASQIRKNPKAISKLLYQEISDSDIRKELWDPTGKTWPISASYDKAPYMNRKFKVVDTASSVADLPFMRLSELYLIVAEAKAHLKETDAADVLFTLVSNRDPFYPKSEKTGESLLQEIWTQRRIELWGEGFRFTDLKRLNLPLDRTASNHKENLCRVLSVKAESINWEFLIPKKELNANELVVQNPM